MTHKKSEAGFEKSLARVFCTAKDCREYEALLVVLAGPRCDFDVATVAARVGVPLKRVAELVCHLRRAGLWPTDVVEVSVAWGHWLAVQVQVALGEATFEVDAAWGVSDAGRRRLLHEHPVRAHGSPF